MLKVLVIDDEKLVRQMVIRCIDWEELGFQIVGEASSGRMGIEMADKLCPDLICIDVRMPGMDGLVCSRRILEKNPNIKILVLSGHDEFEYASEGIRIGVFDYLLKPINALELQSAVQKAKQAILEEEKKSKEFERYKEELEKHSGYIRDRQLSALVYDGATKQCLESLLYFGVELKGEVYQTAVIEVQASENYSYEEEKLLIKMHARAITEDYFGDRQGIFIFDSGARGIVVLNNVSEDLLYEQCPHLKEYLENNIEARVCIGVGNVYSEPEKIRKSCREAEDALKLQFVSAGNGILYYRDIYRYYDTDGTAEVSEDMLHEFGNALRISDGKNAVLILDALLEQMKKAGGGRNEVLVAALQIIAEIMKALSELKMDIQSESLDYSDMIKNIFILEKLGDIRKYLADMAEKACELIREEISDKEKGLVHKTTDYIKEHYEQEELSLNLLAKMFYVNSSYLSRVFKEKTGNTFSGYLFEIRMAEAEKLIRFTELKSYEIAEKVGIPDPHYFGKCFKKYTGLSVSDYKKNCDQNL